MQCTSLGSNMEGVCHQDGKAIFVPGMLPGESGPVQILKAQDRFSFGKLNGPLENPSPSRRESDCNAFPKCGGCTARHMTYESTLENKKRIVEQCFHSIAHTDLELPPVIGMDTPYHYRNKSSFPIGGTGDDPILGFYAPRSHRIIPVTSCMNAMEPANEICHVFLEWVKHYHVSIYNEETHSGLLRHLIIRINHRHDVMVTLVSTRQHLPHLDELVAKLLPFHLSTLIVNVNQKPTNVILGENFYPVYGDGHLHDQLSGLDFELSSASFFQVNREQAEKIYDLAIQFAELDRNAIVYDVYCGTGTISLLAAKSCKKVIGIEYVNQAVQNAKKNAARNHLENAEFYAGKAEDLLPVLVKQNDAPDVIIVDPPRKGLDSSVIDTMCSTNVPKIVYVSCNPATLARDVAIIQKHGYTVQKIQSVDMFCWTSDVETVCLLSKLKST